MFKDLPDCNCGYEKGNGHSPICPLYEEQDLRIKISPKGNTSFSCSKCAKPFIPSEAKKERESHAKEIEELTLPNLTDDNSDGNAIFKAGWDKCKKEVLKILNHDL